MNLPLSEFGYYIAHSFGGVHRVHTTSKPEAIQIAQRTNGYVTYHYNDEVYGSYDWSKDVESSINDLYKRRAEQIRAKYDHVVLMYSGGFDSHNVLMSFLKNGLHVDALASMHQSLDEEPDSVLNLEWELQTKHKIKAITDAHPNIEFYKVDYSQLSLDSLKDKSKDIQFLSGTSTLFCPTTSGITDLKRLLPEKYQSNNTCLLWGIDKPRLRFKDNKFYFNFLDAGFAIRPSAEDSGFEYFYWSADLPELVIKQAQIVKRFWSANPTLIYNHPKNSRTNNGIFLDAALDPVQRLVYPYCEHGVYLSWPPPPDNPFGRRDLHIFRSNTEHSYLFFDRVKSLRNSIDQKYFKDGDKSKPLAGMITKDYIL